ncbi:MAG: DUF4838 domain-containing protein [Kiritimatiellae bacterium]|nr:DUF4838 domain-containing protein [Kiritimatiellia bacterium]
MNRITVALAAALSAGAVSAFDAVSLEKVEITATGGELTNYAAGELARLLGRAGVKASVRTAAGAGESVSLGAPRQCDVSSVRHDGFVKSACKDGVTVAAACGKGVLNGVYTIAEELGFSFIAPGEKGELVPRRMKPVKDEVKTVNPRFERRGLFASSACVSYTVEEWYAFLAKLKFNSICAHSARIVPERMDLLKKLGFRAEAGGHGMSSCLPRELFDKEPELFRMFQPEDFNGKRMKDSNFCATNPKTRDIVKRNFKKRLEPAVGGGVHAIHAWADDLPGGGWCMCSRCRAFTGTDQSALVMNIEAEAVRELGSSLRVPVIAYHDTMFPSKLFAPAKECFLLFAPRERCYAHALNDPSCAHNRTYHRALKEYQRRFEGVDDAHTFEYYNDKILFRGHTPYLPQVLIGDADAYIDGGITCWMSLHVGGELQGVDWNMLAMSLLAWEGGHTPDSLTARLAAAVDPENPGPWRDYLSGNAAAYLRAWQFCNLPYDIYFDYRFMPERGGESGAELVGNFGFGAKRMREAADALATSAAGTASAGLAAAEAGRARFEALDLDAMTFHQRGLKSLAEYLASGDVGKVAAAIADLEKAAAGLDAALAEFNRIFPPKTGQYYPSFVINWTRPEIVAKIRVYRQALELAAAGK